ncbi:hypothetical protein V6N12_023558 [Hibiscus sabdariffa]|uniref:ABC transmembrane type-1 domain-containing protein n=1 Tax=Hibiscus sabdariffa TaxID=183260 RepID=A0ABR2FYM5_9ROSI
MDKDRYDKDADIYLFDDPFSAVDAHTGSHLFKEVLLNTLCSKTVIYVTHQVEFLPAADLILVMKDGKIVQAGKYNDILNSGTDFMELVGAHNKALSSLDDIEARSASERTMSEGEGAMGSANGKLQKEENQGNESAGYKTATLLFEKMHSCIFRAPMSFFDSTPSGRILNRASTDQSAVDLNISYQVGAFAFSVIQLLGIIAVMSQVAWQIFIIFIPVIATCLWYQQYYISSARELSRLVGGVIDPAIAGLAVTYGLNLNILQAWVKLIAQTVIGHTMEKFKFMICRYDMPHTCHSSCEEPTMFEGTIRSNLDPLEEYTDEQIWEALDKCQLGDGVRMKEGRLDSSVSESGENWSMGQRHDMVLLLNHGLIEEYDSPSSLLENKSSSFAQLVAEYTVRSNSRFEKSE